jgi:hypothetical protein
MAPEKMRRFAENSRRLGVELIVELNSGRELRGDLYAAGDHGILVETGETIPESAPYRNIRWLGYLTD